ncbi:MAG TPA: nuclear transport factor 2 family protein [Tepidisphaeraceae bacterium]|jgi:ketosteroid isomerase-like protein|nr:nuclear transport factor 2 family protein [Tepidisphaeraceae bacterium]
MSAKEVGKKLVELCNQGKNVEAIEALYSKDIVSVEPMAMPPMPAETRGIEGVLGKTKWWIDNHEIHASEAVGPFVARDQFIVEFNMEITNKPTGKRMKMSEAGIYTVKDGKVIREEFFYLEG